MGNPIYEAGKWNDQDCTLFANFICEKSSQGSSKGKILIFKKFRELINVIKGIQSQLDS